MVEGAVAGSSTGEGGYGERDGSAPQPYPTHQKTEILPGIAAPSTVPQPTMMHTQGVRVVCFSTALRRLNEQEWMLPCDFLRVEK